MCDNTGGGVPTSPTPTPQGGGNPAESAQSAASNPNTGAPVVSVTSQQVTMALQRAVEALCGTATTLTQHLQAAQARGGGGGTAGSTGSTFGAGQSTSASGCNPAGSYTTTASRNPNAIHMITCLTTALPLPPNGIGCPTYVISSTGGHTTMLQGPPVVSIIQLESTLTTRVVEVKFAGGRSALVRVATNVGGQEYIDVEFDDSEVQRQASRPTTPRRSRSRSRSPSVRGRGRGRGSGRPSTRQSRC